MAFASGFGQGGAIAALGDVAKHFGHVVHGTTLADQAGLSGTVLGVGLAVLAPGVARRAAPGRVGRPLRATDHAPGDVLAGPRVHRPRRGQSRLLVVRRSSSPWADPCSAPPTPSPRSVRPKRPTSATAPRRWPHRGGVRRGHRAHGGDPRADEVDARVPGPVPPRRGPAGSRSSSSGGWLVETGPFHGGGRRAPAPRAGASARWAAPYRWRLLTVASLAFAVAVVTGPANSFVFVYAQNVLKMSGDADAAMVAVASVFGLGGLLLGRVLADRLGRRPTGALAMTAMALTGILAYSGSRDGARSSGYELGVLAAATLAPAAGALANELFPTSVRASVAGMDRGRQRGRCDGRARGLRRHRGCREPLRRRWRGHVPPGHPRHRRSSPCSPRPRATSPRICGPTSR